MRPADHIKEGALTIFLFHGVVKRSDYRIRNYTAKHLEQAVFERVLDEVLAVGNPVSLDQLIAGEELPPGAFAITFDDGFENNLSVAAPLLAARSIPATFYVTTGFVEENGMSWTDRLEYCLENAPAGSVRLPWRDRSSEFDSDTSRRALMQEIRDQVKTTPDLDVNRFVSEFFGQCGQEEVRSSRDPLDLKLSWDQVRELADGPGFTVGGHTHTHAILSFLGEAELAEELDTSLRLLDERAGVGPRHYSYPEGLAHCYSPKVQHELRERGVLCCPTAIEGTNPPGTDLFELRRIMIAG